MQGFYLRILLNEVSVHKLVATPSNELNSPALSAPIEIPASRKVVKELGPGFEGVSSSCTAAEEKSIFQICNLFEINFFSTKKTSPFASCYNLVFVRSDLMSLQQQIRRTQIIIQ